MSNLVVSSVLESNIAPLLSGDEKPDGKNLFSLSLFIEALCLSKDVLAETLDPDQKYSRLGLKGICFEGPAGDYLVNGRELSRMELTWLAEEEWTNKLSRFSTGDVQGLGIWIKYYFLDAFKQGYDIQPAANFYPGHLSIHLALNSPNWIPKAIIDELQKRRESSIEEARKLIGQNSYRVGVPYLLRLVLNESKSPDDIVKVANSIRSLSSMKSFRNWVNRLDTKSESDELTDKDYRSILEARAKIASSELGSKSNTMNILESVSFSTNPTEPSLSLGISIIDLLVQAGKTVTSSIKNRHLAFINYLENQIDTTKDIKSLVRKVWKYEMTERDIAMFTNLSKLGEKAIIR